MTDLDGPRPRRVRRAIRMLALVLQVMPVSIAHAVWSGVGTAAIAFIGATFLGERWDLLEAGARGTLVRL